MKRELVSTHIKIGSPTFASKQNEATTSKEFYVSPRHQKTTSHLEPIKRGVSECRRENFKIAENQNYTKNLLNFYTSVYNQTTNKEKIKTGRPAI